jgi:Ca2+-binding EF-hand superfamily protein
MAQKRWCTRQTYRQRTPIKNEAIQGNEQVKAISTQGTPSSIRIFSTSPQSNSVDSVSHFVIIKVISENLSPAEIMGLKQMFNNMDTDRSGTISVDELKEGLNKLGSNISEAEAQELMEAVRSHFGSVSAQV